MPMRAAAAALCLAQFAAAQLARPRKYCLVTLPVDDNICIDGDEYTVLEVVPPRGYARQSGQTVAILGTNFPPGDTHPISCTFGTAPPGPAVFVSTSEIRCPVPQIQDAGAVQIQLEITPGQGTFTSRELRYDYREPDATLVDLNQTTLFDVLLYLQIAAGVVAVLLCVSFCYLWRKRRAVEALSYEPRAAASATGAGESLRKSLLDEDAKDARDCKYDSWASDAPAPTRRRRLSLTSTQAEGKPCYRRARCACVAGFLNGVWAVSALTIVLVMIYALDMTDLSGGNPDFNTLSKDEAASTPTSFTIAWDFHMPQLPETLQYEVAIATVGGASRRRRRMQGSGQWTPVYFGPDTSFQFNDLQPRTQYAFRLRFYENNIPGLWSTAEVFETAAPTVPQPPTGVVLAETSDTSITLAWGAVTDNGSPVSNYELDCEVVGTPEPTPCPGSAQPASRDPSTGRVDRRQEFAGLTAGTGYQLCVRALNSEGSSECSGWVLATTNDGPDTTVPATPTQLTEVSKTPNSITVDVGVPPTSDGGAEILALLCAIQDPDPPNELRVLSAGLPPGTTQVRIIADLSPDTPYTFQTALANSAGISEYSDPVTITTDPATPPDVPGAFIQTELWNTFAKLRWEQPADGGEPITSYELEVTGITNTSIPVRTLTVAPPTGCPDGTPPPELYMIDDLVLSHEYGLRVRAVNAVGAGAWSSALTTYTFVFGQCGGDPVPAGQHNDATVWNANLPQFSAAMASACGGCLGIRACFLPAWRDLFDPPYSDACASCWGDTCQCSTGSCIPVPCLIGSQADCDQCVIDNCNEGTQQCTGVPKEFIPRG